MKEANYSNGDYYHYTYDAVGNRLTQNAMVASQTSNVAYLYDNANRLSSVNGVTYTFDVNGNTLTSPIGQSAYRLLNDGVNTCIAVVGLYNAHGHKLRFPSFEKAQFVTVLGITL